VDERPVTGYAKAPDGVDIAHQVSGDGPDLLFLPMSAIPIDLLWDEPSFVRFAKRLGGFSRTICCDSRGTGASGGNLLDVQDAVEDADVMAVPDAAGCERVVLVGSGHGGPPPSTPPTRAVRAATEIVTACAISPVRERCSCPRS